MSFRLSLGVASAARPSLSNLGANRRLIDITIISSLESVTYMMSTGAARPAVPNRVTRNVIYCHLLSRGIECGPAGTRGLPAAGLAAPRDESPHRREAARKRDAIEVRHPVPLC